jgi:gluconate 2-dehydrogenase gamma chain
LTFPFATITVQKRKIGIPLISELDRRKFLSRGIAALGATWTAAHWPAIVAASEHAHHVALFPEDQKWEFFTPAEAKEVEALASCIIPSNDTPGAKEAGVVYFIDRALVTFSIDDQKTYRAGLPDLQKRVAELFPGVETFSAATAEQQISVLESLDDSAKQKPPNRPRANRNTPAQPLFETVRAHTIAGFLIDPEVDRKGNRGGVGWALIGRDPGHSFQPPFSAVDKDYSGWQPATSASAATKDADKK